MSEHVEPSKGQRREKLVALLERIRQRAAEPRPAKLHVAMPMPSVHSAVTVPHSYSSSEPETEHENEKVRMVIEPFAKVSGREAFLPQVSAPRVEPRVDEGWSEPPPAASDVEVAEGAEDHEEPIALTRGRPSALMPAVVLPSPPPPPAQTEELSAESGEFAVAEMPLELEELGPADEIEDGESVVEIHIGTPAEERARDAAIAAENSPEDEIAARMESDRVEKRDSQPPESGRELVGAPHESARLRVASDVPRAADPLASVRDSGAVSDVQELESIELEDAPPSFHEPPPRSPRVPSSVKPPSGPPPHIPDELAEPPVSIRLSSSSSDRIVAPPDAPPPTPPVIAESAIASMSAHAEIELAPPTARPGSDRPIAMVPSIPSVSSVTELAPPVAAEVVNTAVEIAKTPVAVAVAFAGAHEHLERVTVGIEGVVIRPEITPTDVAAILGAVRDPSPASFGALVDAALSLGS